jgi:tetratricopeptide (TPR) repeat protein
MLLPYINLAQYNFKSENITEQELTERYDKIKEIINLKSQNGELENKENISETVDDIYYAAILGVGDAVDCELIKEKLGPRLESNPSDLKLAKQIFSLMVSNKCTEDPLWMYTAEIILENEPDYGLYKILGQKSMSTGELDKAQENLSKAAELADNAEEKSEIYLLMGSLKEKSGAKAEARSWYQKALQEGSSEKDAYNALGYLYYRSSEDCMEKENIVRDRAIFILAYEMFVKAGNTEMAAQTKEQFPSKEEIFLQNYSAGDPIDIRCWVRREVNLQTRD